MTHLSHDIFRCPGRELSDCENCLRKIIPGHPTHQTMAYGFINIKTGECEDLIKGELYDNKN